MCGIAGFISGEIPTDQRRLSVERMNAAMRHRGPDDDGLISTQTATIGMRRLAVFDPVNGHQPMSTPDGRIHLVFNGAIYNHHELRAELTANGAVFRTDCDTEVLLYAFAFWGEGCLRRFRGMFAFAAWDTLERTLFVARDPFGIKPLYYFHRDTNFIFASELRALLASGHCDKKIDPEALSTSLAYLAVPAPRTLYRRIFSLRPGECATFHDGKLTVKTYWSFRDAISFETKVTTTRAEFVSELRLRLDDSIRAHSLADVPIGAFLSGGLDSSVVVGLMRRLTSGRLKTFSVGFEEEAYSEASEAAEAARHFQTEHSTLVLTAERVAQDLNTLVASYDQPTGDGVNTYYVSEAARQGGVTVALSGLGGDELFGGYPWFRTTPRLARWLPLWRALPEGVRRSILQRLDRGDSRQQKLCDFLQHSRNLHELAGLQRRNCSEHTRRSLLHADLGFTAHAELAHLPSELAGATPFEVISAWELRSYMADVLLRDSDVMSMRHSLELRVPFVDRPLIEWLWRQPTRFKNDQGRPKGALTDAVADLLPRGLITRKKRGFTLPFALWMRGPLLSFLEDTFSPANVARSGLFNAGNIQTRWQEFLWGNDHREWARVWTLAITIAWVNRQGLSAE